MNNKTRLKINNETIKSKIIRYIKPGFIIFNVLLILISISSAATSQTPYSGTALKVPGTIQTENFDNGGEGIAYHDTETANQGNQYRPADGVDTEITSDIGGGYNIGWTLPGEWLEYTVNVANTGNYNLEARVAYGGTGGTFHIEFNGVDKTGPITVPDTGSYQTWKTLTKTVSLSAGQQVMKIVMDKKGDYNVANINYIRITPLQSSYSGTPLAIPGTIQAENFDLGGEGIAYHDTETANQGNQYRPADGVDTEITSDIGGGYNIGWTLPGEWLAYTVNVANTGNYNLETRVAYGGTGGTFHIEFNGVDKTGPITVPDTGSYQTWKTLTKTVSLSAGQQVMKIVMDKIGDYNVGNINYIRITPTSTLAPAPIITPAKTPTSIPTSTPTPAPTPVSNSPAYYVATNGNDGNSGKSTSSPWRTIQHAANTASAGDTVYVMGGTYKEKITITRSGSSGNYITFAVYPGQTATIDGTGLVSQWDGIFTVKGASHIKISGFKIQNSDYAGVRINGDGTSQDVIVEKNYINNIYSSALYAERARNIVYDGNEVTGSHTAAMTTENEVIDVVKVDGFEIKNNYVHDNVHAESITAKEGASNGLIHHNNVKPVESAGIYLCAWTDMQQNIEVYDNIIHDGPGSSRGIAMAVEGGGSLKNIKVYNNIVYNNGAYGINVAHYNSCDANSLCISGPIDNIKIEYNTVYRNDYASGWGGGIVSMPTDATNIVIRNNIVSQNNMAQISVAGSSNTVQNNLIDGPGSIIGSGYVIGNPRFVNPSSGDFHIQSISPAIDKGTSTGAPSTDFDGTPRPHGAGYDIGAFEY